MSATLIDRGPDSEGSFVDAGVGLAARRLAVIDLAGGDQPIANEDRTCTVVQNGGLYNFAELTHELRRAGHTFRTQSDTEAIVHAYEECVSGREDLSRQIWSLLAFTLWFERHVEGVRRGLELDQIVAG
jgi:asparagine synthase (glutamine-hydrolysing)